MKLLNNYESIKPENEFFLAFLGAVLWSEYNLDGEPLEDDFSFSDIDQPSADMIKTLCNEFIEKAGNDAILENNYAQAGHDFYLTIAGHGAGFWDGNWVDNGDYLIEICENWINDITVYTDGEQVYINVSIIGNKA